MIVKERRANEHDDIGPMAIAGARAEAQMAHFLKRAFGDDPLVRVFHDLRLLDVADNEAAQIDHLVLYRGGLVLIESKSVTSAVRINRQDEFSRWWNGRWQGMASPVQQLKRQSDFLQALLRSHKSELRRKALFGLLQPGFGNVPFDHLVAISDTGLIERQAGSSPLPVVKADQVVDEIRRHMAYRDVSFLTFGTRKEQADAPWVRFEPEEMERIAAFLLSRHTPRREPVAAEPSSTLVAAPPSTPTPRPQAIQLPPSCRYCHVTDVAVHYGRNYYLVCTACRQNTPIDLTCGGCDEKARIRKEGLTFHKECQGCGLRVVYHRNASAV